MAAGKRGDMAFGHEAVIAQLRLELAQRIGAAEAEGRGVAPRPEARAVGHDEQRRSPRSEDAPAFPKDRARMFARFKPVHQDKLVDAARLDRPERFLAQDRHVGHARGQGITPC
jgi:hypothetical protein